MKFKLILMNNFPVGTGRLFGAPSHWVGANSTVFISNKATDEFFLHFIRTLLVRSQDSKSSKLEVLSNGIQEKIYSIFNGKMEEKCIN